MSKIVTGDLLQLAEQGQFDVVVHGCNCLCHMGKGIALQIRKQYPAAYDADLATVAGDQRKLGTISQADVGTFTIINAYTQYHWHGDGNEVLSINDAIRDAFLEVKRLFSGKRIAYPMVGATLARGDWSEIYPIICDALEGEDHTLVILTS